MTSVKLLTESAKKAAGFWIDKGNIAENLKKNFEKTKVVSDFVGMILRFGFSLGATTYFGKRVSSPAHWFEPYAFGACWITSLGLTCVLGSGIVAIIFAYEMRAVGDSARTSTRWLFFVIAVVMTLCLWYGLNDLAG